MVEKPESGNRLIHVIIPAATTLLVAIIGLGTAIYQTEKPVQLTAVAQTALSATRTAAAPAELTQTSPANVASTLVAETVQAVMISTEAAQTIQARPVTVEPVLPTTTILPTIAVVATDQSFTVNNKLNLSVKIIINKVAKGDVDAASTKTFQLASFPATVEWSVNKWTTLKGDPLGHDMGGTFTGINSGDELIIDNTVDNQPFFYPIITNTTATDCDVTINKGWKSEYVTHAIVPANTADIGMGYYKLFANSNVTLICGRDTYWWGQQPGNSNDTSFYDEVAKDTGVITFTLKP